MYKGKRSKKDLMKSLATDAILTTVRKSHNNTLVYSLKNGGIGYQLHDTEIMRNVDGVITLNSGGYKTVTTKSRLNDILPHEIGIYQKAGIWYLYTGSFNNPNRKTYVFNDGITINCIGQFVKDWKVSNHGGDPKDILALYKRVNKFAKAYINALFEGNVSAPDNGDCRYCLFKDENGVIMGELSKNTDHILNHLEEGYFVPSMLVNAVETFPVSKVAMWTLGDLWGKEKNIVGFIDIAKQQLLSSLRRYIKRQLGLAT